MENKLAIVNTSDEWVVLQKQCKAFLASGFLPDHISKGVSPEQAMAKAITIAVKGRELGIPPMQAFSSITVIAGKPCLSAELMLALIYQRRPGAKVTFTTPPDKQNEECTIVMQRPDGDPQTFRFSMNDAKAAGLLSKPGAWAKFPAAMLRARAISAGARAVFPDCIMGCYTPEELGHPEIVDVDHTAAESPQLPPETKAEVKEAISTRCEPEKLPFEVGSSGQKIDKRGFPHGEYPPTNPNWREEPCTEAQVKRLHALGKEYGYDHDQLKDLVLAMKFAEIDHLDELTKGEIQEVFKAIEAPKAGEA